MLIVCIMQIPDFSQCYTVLKNNTCCARYYFVPFDAKFRPTVQIFRPQDSLCKKNSSDVYNAVVML